MKTGKMLVTAVLCMSLMFPSTNTLAADGVAINDTVFSATQIRLNMELYDTAAEIFNSKHIMSDYGEAETMLAKSFLNTVDPLVPLALTINETGMWMDTRYTWTSGIYSKLLSKSGVNMDRINTAQVNVDAYVVNGLCEYYGCGTNCTASKDKHYHTIGNNDNDSLGPLQILRHYVEDKSVITYSCGESVIDLMSWEDNVVYFTHNQSRLFMASDNWNSAYKIQNTYELAALMGTAHNTGTAFLSNSTDAGSLWNDPESVYAYCEAISTDEALKVVDKYVNNWWEDVLTAQESGTSFILLGQYPTSTMNAILAEMGVDKTRYAKRFEHKQYYPLKAMLNYACLYKLYHSKE